VQVWAEPGKTMASAIAALSEEALSLTLAVEAFMDAAFLNAAFFDGEDCQCRPKSDRFRETKA